MAEVVVISESGLAQQIVAGGQRWQADEPLPIGTDTGPSPYELLLSSLGACTSMTLRLYAQRKQWDLQRVTVRLRHYRIHAEDCADCESKQGYLDRIDREIELTGALDETQRQRLLEIAERCPVHRTLKSEIAIRTYVTSTSS
jgi:putative redox protein